MTHGAHKHDHSHKDHAHNQEGPWWKHVHRSWMFWTALVLMVAAIVIYVMTNNEMFGPSGVKDKLPAAMP